MHVECPNCRALFDEEENTRCPRCQTPVEEIAACGGCGGCGCHSGNSHHTGCQTCGGCGRG